jgi:hypothetical protein
VNQSGIADGTLSEKAEGRTCVRPSPVTRLNTPSLRRSEGRCGQLGSLSEPHRKQNLYANPKRTAKTQNKNNNCNTSDCPAGKKFKLFSFFFARRSRKNLDEILEAPPPDYKIIFCFLTNKNAMHTIGTRVLRRRCFF